MNNDLSYFDQMEQDRKARKQATLNFEQMREDWRQLFFGSELGQKVFGDMLTFCDFFGTSFTGNSKGFFNSGLKYFITMIIDFAGLDDVDGLHRISQIKANVERMRSTGMEE